MKYILKSRWFEPLYSFIIQPFRLLGMFYLNLSLNGIEKAREIWPQWTFWFQAFAWFSDLLVEHSEIFWSLFGVDMDTVLNEQPPDTWVYHSNNIFHFLNFVFYLYRWDSFPLFLILNDYLRTDDNLKNGKFHQHLRTTFAPQVVRYVDLMESSIAQSIHKGFEKERWEIKG